MTRLATLVAIAACAPAAAAQTIGELRNREVPVQPGPAAPVEPERVREAYRRFLELEAGDAVMRAEALRRLADLELEAAEAARGEGESTTAGAAGTRSAIAIYEELLNQNPNYPRVDSVLYQLGRAWEAEGDPGRALAYLDRLVERFPGSRHIDEAQFRRGEIHFSEKRWNEAGDAYAAVIAMKPESAFHEQSLYKHGWARFKLSDAETSAASLLRLLDRKLQASPGVEIAAPEALSRADRELVLDAERALGIQFAAAEPA